MVLDKTSTFTKTTRSNLVFVKVKPKSTYTEESCSSYVPAITDSQALVRASSYRLNRPPAVFLSRPDSLVSVAPGDDIVISFEINGGSGAKGKSCWIRKFPIRSQEDYS